MDAAKNASIAKRLGILWLVLSIVLAFAFLGFSVSTAISTGGTLFDAKAAWVWIVIIAEITVLLPLLFLVHYHAQKASMKTLRIVSRIILIHNIVCVACLLLFALTQQ